ncbi:type II toxin-antitoxin system VapC family toxin [Roseomonas sp. CCTCC AB2023176]|uniref:type II toxin-antitoxin system VapC family toxin n=1 Tax=Roseomonas sp. CCTCC AB2023176 TaxID=3342640 RepID=UPI0035E160CA
MTDVTLVDTGVLLDLLTDDPVWAAWAQGRIAIYDVVYAETSMRFARVEGLDAFLADTSVQREPTPLPALLLAGRAHLSYRRTEGVRRGVLSDLLVGAHAVVGGWMLLTRDPARFRTCFPSVRSVVPRSCDGPRCCIQARCPKAAERLATTAASCAAL